MNLGWHYVVLKDGAPILRDGRPLPPVGEWLEEKGDVVICERGLHASWRAVDALGYASPVPLAACLVEVDDIVTEHDDKFVCRRRRVLAWSPCDDVLRLFAREAALSVLHLWKGEVPAVVREYLETGRKEIRWAASSAAESAAESAARLAAWSAARSAAWSAAWSAAESAAWSAAESAAWSAAESAARSAAISDMNATLESMLLAEMGWAP